MIASLASLGVFVSLPIVGMAVLGPSRLARQPAATIPLAMAAGLGVWSIPMLLSVIVHAFVPVLLGSAGWAVTGWWLLSRGRRLSLQFPALNAPDVALAIGLVIAFCVYALAPADPLITGRDMGVYASHGAYIAGHGRLDVAYPPGIDPTNLPPGWISLAGVYDTRPTQTLQFGHLYPLWLAQAYAVGDFGALVRLNAFLAVLASLAVYGVARRWAPAWIATLAALGLAFNAGQVWVARTTLSEVLTQLFIWSALLLLTMSTPERRRSDLMWAGAFIGLAALVRIDSLVMLPLLIGGFAIASTRSQDLSLRASLPFFGVALPILAIAAGFYAAFSTPYFNDLAGHLLPVAAATMAAAVLYAALVDLRLRTAVGGLIGRTPFLAVVVASVLALAAFAYFIRPNLEPFAVITTRGHFLQGSRSYIENAMSNLGQYLGTPTVWLGVGGWLGATVVAVRRREALIIPVLAVIGGTSALYFWNPQVFPDHFWAVRRYVPIIMPATMVLAAAAGWFILQRMPRTLRPYAFGAAVLFVAAQTWRAGTPAFFVAEREGAHATLAQVAAATPSGEAYVGIFTTPGARSLATPLRLTFDEPIVPLDATTDGGREELLRRIEGASSSSPIVIVTNRPHDTGFLRGRTLASRRLDYRFVTPTYRPPPSQVSDAHFELLVMEVDGLSTLDVPFGTSPSWIATEGGFHETEVIDGFPLRWTSATATITVPVYGGTADRLSLDIARAGPDGTNLLVKAGGRQIAAIHVPPDGWKGLIDLPHPASEEVEIGLTSDSFVPRDTFPGSTDSRNLGVLVRAIAITGDPGP